MITKETRDGKDVYVTGSGRTYPNRENLPEAERSHLEAVDGMLGIRSPKKAAEDDEYFDLMSVAEQLEIRRIVERENEILQALVDRLESVEG